MIKYLNSELDFLFTEIFGKLHKMWRNHRKRNNKTKRIRKTVPCWLFLLLSMWQITTRKIFQHGWRNALWRLFCRKIHAIFFTFFENLIMDATTWPRYPASPPSIATRHRHPASPPGIATRHRHPALIVFSLQYDWKSFDLMMDVLWHGFFKVMLLLSFKIHQKKIFSTEAIKADGCQLMP